ncbi:MAG: nucleotide-binding universal stress UspA family protein [Octadecabacter sp.]|jgi:nucleotide-binding universal stress UspA family protein
MRNAQIEESIVAYADEREAYFIIVKSPNQSRLEALLDTSVARQVTISAFCPVLVVPEPG